jgi:hypothetical protein
MGLCGVDVPIKTVIRPQYLFDDRLADPDETDEGRQSLTVLDPCPVFVGFDLEVVTFRVKEDGRSRADGRIRVIDIIVFTVFIDLPYGDVPAGLSNPDFSVLLIQGTP